MTVCNIAFLDKNPEFRTREDKGDYDTRPEARAAAADHAWHLHKAQGLIGEALNLAGLLLAALEDEGDARAMQTYTAVRIIEKRLVKACRRIDKYDAEQTERLLSFCGGA